MAEIIADLRPGKIARLVEVRMMSRRAGETLRELPEGILRNVLQGISNDRLALMIGRQTPEDELTFFTLLSDEQRRAVEALLPREQSEAIAALHRYPEGSAGTGRGGAGRHRLGVGGIRALSSPGARLPMRLAPANQDQDDADGEHRRPDDQRELFPAADPVGQWDE